jgi:hypothetical protein
MPNSSATATDPFGFGSSNAAVDPFSSTNTSNTNNGFDAWGNVSNSASSLASNNVKAASDPFSFDSFQGADPFALSNVSKAPVPTNPSLDGFSPIPTSSFSDPFGLPMTTSSSFAFSAPAPVPASTPSHSYLSSSVAPKSTSISSYMPNTTTLGNPFQLPSNADEVDDDVFDMKSLAPPPPPPSAAAQRTAPTLSQSDDIEFDRNAISKLRQMYNGTSEVQANKSTPVEDDIDDDEDFRYTGPKGML